MGKAMKKKPRPVRVPCPSGEDATPQRLAHGDHELSAGIIDRAGERTPLVRKFRSSHLDRLHKSHAIDQAQWFAGNWYREQYARGATVMRVVASYGEHTGAGTHPGDFGYGLPRQEAQVRARERWRRARDEMPMTEWGFMDRFLLHDDLPRYKGATFMRSMAQIRRNLDVLVQHLKVSHMAQERA
ncbi:hypothetical protein ASE67_02570 [Sphingomonas sp. Leaf23]|uniref:hypothetical protein n=1 Tax=Sphingomonas sp. Leaf23 TaxID=1735689 RepID=UPI0006FB14DA|nr:hypothetical protein [Sphingomonas sp. Leaf23]KQM88644.1 hypothetical protein ASE67_02570 [Sphingomonas sp. Leaf23]